MIIFISRSILILKMFLSYIWYISSAKKKFGKEQLNVPLVLILFLTCDILIFFIEFENIFNGLATIKKMPVKLN